MSSDYDATEFVDGDLQGQKSTYAATAGAAGPALRAPSREEVETKVAEAQQKLAELKRAQEQLEHERAALEETRRRQMEFHAGRQEMIQHLTRGLGLLEEAEFNARRDAEQMSRAMVDLRDALTKVEAIHEETWTRDNFNIELTRALTTLENARMEWNGARLRFPLLAAMVHEGPPSPTQDGAPHGLFATYSFGELCRLGFALTWPLAAVAVAAILLMFLLRR
jgi:hypothetical protein